MKSLVNGHKYITLFNSRMAFRQIGAQADKEVARHVHGDQASVHAAVGAQADKEVARHVHGDQAIVQAAVGDHNHVHVSRGGQAQRENGDQARNKMCKELAPTLRNL